MLQFIAQNIGTIITCLILLVIIGLALRGMIVNRKKGKCSCGCAGCPSAGVCHGSKKR